MQEHCLSLGTERSTTFTRGVFCHWPHLSTIGRFSNVLNVERLESVEKRFDTDKYESGYIPYYLDRVRAPKRILEVGVNRGGSLLLWCDLWPSVEEVIGVDMKEPLIGLHQKISTFQADQTDLQALQQIGSTKGPFDLIIDDASH